MKPRSFLRPLLVAASLLPVTPLHAQTPTPTPTPAEGYVDAFKTSSGDTLANRQARAALRISARMVSGEAQLLATFRALYQSVWHNADGLTPQQVCDALGTKAANLFVIAGTMANALYGIDPAGLGAMVTLPPGYTATINPDGTVTIVYTAPSPSPTPAP